MRVTSALAVLALVAVPALAHNKYEKKNEYKKKAKKHHKTNNKETRVCKAIINQSGITGFLKFSQPYMHAPVKLEVNLQGLPTAIQGPLPWHIHNLPVEGPCTSTGGHWSPQGLPDQLIGGCMGNMCQIGDLANRIGPFTTPTVKYTVPLNFTTLFGPLSICGRSIVIHNGTTPTIRQACGTITPQYKEVTAVATLVATTATGSPAAPDTVPKGTVTFKQQKGKPNSEVSVLVNLTATTPSTGHPYHVHAIPVPANGSCTLTGPHWNINGGPVCTLPQSTLTPFPGCPFDTLLWPFCENGDLAGKHGLLNLPAVGPTRLFYHDNQITLQGANSIVGLSVVVHQNVTNTFRIACGNIIKTYT